jgi:hypothetical protein
MASLYTGDHEIDGGMPSLPVLTAAEIGIAVALSVLIYFFA